MNIENAKSQMRKGMLEYCVLLLLKHRPSYASDIIQQLKKAELLVVEGTLYPLLTRLKNDGLLQYEWQESTQGPPRKYYALSPEGEQFLEGLDSAWTELANTINYLKNIHPNLIEAKKRTNKEIKIIKGDYKVPDDMKKIGAGKKYYLKTYGCQMNVHESEKIAGMLVELGYSECSSVEDADIIVINTCGFIESSKVESINTILDMIDYKNDNKISFNVVYSDLNIVNV